MSTFQRRRDGHRLYEPTEAEDRAYAECDRSLDWHFAEVDAYEAMLEHVGTWQAGEGQLKIGMHGALCLREGGEDCICTGREVTVFVQDPADRLDGPVCDNPYWAEAPR